MNILVTGGSGFIGSHVVDVLLEQGHRVKIYDVDSPKYGQACDFIKADVIDLVRLVKETAQGDADLPHRRRGQRQPLPRQPVLFLEPDHLGLDAQRPRGGPDEQASGRVLLASTEWVYGSDPSNPDVVITEETPDDRRSRPHLHLVQDRGRALLQELPPHVRRELHHHALRHPLRRAGPARDRDPDLHPQDPRRRGDHDPRRRQPDPPVHLRQGPRPGHRRLPPARREPTRSSTSTGGTGSASSTSSATSSGSSAGRRGSRSSTSARASSRAG